MKGTGLPAPLIYEGRTLIGKSWKIVGLPDKFGEFVSVCGSAFVVLILGLIYPMFFVLCAFLAALILIFGTLAILGIK